MLPRPFSFLWISTLKAATRVMRIKASLNPLFSFALMEDETVFSRACIRGAINPTLIRHQFVAYHASGIGLGRLDAQSGLSRARLNLN
jgi:hypothetical protein